MAKKDISFEDAQGYVRDGRFDDAIRYFVQQGLCPGDVREQFGGDAFLRFGSYQADRAAISAGENLGAVSLEGLKAVGGKFEYPTPDHFIMGVVQYVEKRDSEEGILVSGDHRLVSGARRDTGEPDLYDLEFSFRRGEVRHFWRNRHGARIYPEDEEGIEDVVEKELLNLFGKLEEHGMQISLMGKIGLKVKYPR
jgi:hypothetical protein